MSNLKMEIKKVKAWYDNWRKRTTYSPALECNVRVSLKGWNHLVGNQKFKKRTVQDKYRRLKLLPHAEEIITKSTTIQNITEKSGRKYFAIEAMVKVKENNHEEYRKVRVIIYQDKNGEKVFYSVMDKKSKAPHA